MIVKDAEKDLSACLRSVQGLLDDIVIVDTGSTDRTSSVAHDHGARLFAFNFNPPNFSAARNFSLSHAKGDWICVLDSDETLSPDSISTVRRLVSADQSAGYYAERHNYHQRDAATTIDYVVRLFRNRPDYRYAGRVHETIDASIRQAGGHLCRSGIRIEHAFSSDPQSRRRKNAWYIKILLEELVSNPADHSRLDFLAAEYHQLGLYDEALGVTEQIVKHRPNDAQARLHAGVYHLLHREDAARAAQFFHEALILRPNYPEALSFLNRARGADLPDRILPRQASQPLSQHQPAIRD
jgi:glycosyltransferase involved in cell wall biosynthesis